MFTAMFTANFCTKESHAAEKMLGRDAAALAGRLAAGDPAFDWQPLATFMAAASAPDETTEAAATNEARAFAVPEQEEEARAAAAPPALRSQDEAPGSSAAAPIVFDDDEEDATPGVHPLRLPRELLDLLRAEDRLRAGRGGRGHRLDRNLPMLPLRRLGRALHVPPLRLDRGRQLRREHHELGELVARPLGEPLDHLPLAERVREPVTGRHDGTHLSQQRPIRDRVEGPALQVELVQVPRDALVLAVEEESLVPLDGRRLLREHALRTEDRRVLLHLQAVLLGVAGEAPRGAPGLGLVVLVHVGAPRRLVEPAGRARARPGRGNRSRIAAQRCRRARRLPQLARHRLGGWQRRGAGCARYGECEEDEEEDGEEEGEEEEEEEEV